MNFRRVTTGMAPAISLGENVATQNDSTQALVKRREYLAEQYGMTTSQIDVVRNAICINATDEELEFFLATCKRVNLDPFARQIWFVKRKQKRTDDRGNDVWIDVGRPETGIDGYRTIAERSGEYEGQGKTEWCGPDGKWLDVWLKRDEPPAAARSTIFRRGFREPLVNVAVFEEYAPRMPKSGDLPAMWRKMAANQLAKCAEAGAFRRAFPRDLSGLVTDTEMEHVDQQAPAYSAPQPVATLPAPASKQIDTRKESPTTSIVNEPPTTAKDAAPATSAKTTFQPWQSMELPPEQMTELARIQESLDHGRARSEIAWVGNLISAAKKKEPDAPRTKLLIDQYWNLFQSTWKTLPEDRK